MKAIKAARTDDSERRAAAERAAPSQAAPDELHATPRMLAQRAQREAAFGTAAVVQRVRTPNNNNNVSDDEGEDHYAEPRLGGQQAVEASDDEGSDHYGVPDTDADIDAEDDAHPGRYFDLEQVAAEHLPNGAIPAELANLQGGLRAAAAAAAVRDPDSRRRRAQQPAAGWAVLGMAGHGLGVDFAEGAMLHGPDTLRQGMRYYDAGQRAQSIAQVVDGRLVRVGGGELPRPNVTVDDVKTKLPIAYMTRVQQAYARHLDGPDRTWMLNYNAQAATEADLAEYKRIRDQVPDREALLGRVRQEVVDNAPLIFVMNAAGQFFVGESQNAVVHHSSFLAGGPIAAAGDVVVSGGVLRRISNNSGHFKPGAAYLWQAVKQLLQLGVDLREVTVEVVNAGEINALEFLEQFNPAVPPSFDRHLSFDAAEAAAAVRAYLAQRRHDRPLV